MFSGGIVIDSHMKWVKESLEIRIPALKIAYHTIFSIKEAKPVTKNAKGTGNCRRIHFGPLRNL